MQHIKNHIALYLLCTKYLYNWLPKACSYGALTKTKKGDTMQPQPLR